MRCEKSQNTCIKYVDLFSSLNRNSGPIIGFSCFPPQVPVQLRNEINRESDVGRIKRRLLKQINLMHSGPHMDFFVPYMNTKKVAAYLNCNVKVSDV
jgi:hypothetical protein